MHKFLIDIDIIKDNQTITDIYSLYINNKIIKREINNDIVNFYYGLYYRYIKKDYELTEHYYLKAIVNFNNNALRELAFYYYKIKMDYDKMKYYLHIAIDMYNDDRSMFIFGSYYQTIEKNYELMKKYYLMAIEKGNSDAMYNLGYYYQYNHFNWVIKRKIYYKEIEEDYKLMKKYYIMAIENNNDRAIQKFFNININEYENIFKV